MTPTPSPALTTATRSPQAATADLLDRLVPGLLLVTGASGLVFQVVLGRYLAIHIGSSGASQAVTLAAFLGGLSAGALAAGRWAASPRRAAASARRTVRTYAALEAFVGLWVLATPWLIEGVFVAYGHLVTGLLPGGLPSLLLRIIAAAALIVPVTLAMGATLPMLASAASRAGAGAVARVSRFYYINAAGAAAGALVAGFWLIEALGFDSSLRLAGGANLLVAGLAALLAREGSTAVSPPESTQGGGTGTRPIVLTAALLTGFVALLCEVVWTRLAGLLLGGSVYAFALMLGIVIAGISIGSAIASALARRGADPLGILAATQVGAAVFTLVLLLRLPDLPVTLLEMRSRLVPVPDNFAVWLVSGGAVIAAHLLPAAACLGAAFPALLGAAAKAGAAPARATAQLLGVNTAGNLVGAFAGGFLVLPQLGLDGALLLGAGMSLANALLLVRRRAMSLCVAAGLAVVLILAMRPPDLHLLYAGLFAPRATEPGAVAEIVRDADANEIVYRADGRDASVTVTDCADGKLRFATNGKVDGGTGDEHTQVTLGHLPFVFRPQAKEVFVLGLGTGQTAGAVAAHSGVHVTVAELLPEIVEVARRFAAFNNRVLDQPNVQVVVTDAREAIRSAPPESYDVIVSEPSNPWVLGNADLFTLDHIEEMRSRLRPGGVYEQWMHTYQTDDAVFRDIACTLRTAFPFVHAFRIGLGDFALIASDTATPLDVGAMEASFGEPAVRRELASHDDPSSPRTLDELLAMEVAGPTAVDALCQGFLSPLRVRHPVLEYRAARAAFSRSVAEYARGKFDTRLDPGTAADTLLAHWLAARPIDDRHRARLARFLEARGIKGEVPLIHALAGRSSPLLVAALRSGEATASGDLCGWLERAREPGLVACDTVFGPSVREAALAGWFRRCQGLGAE